MPDVIDSKPKDGEGSELVGGFGALSGHMLAEVLDQSDECVKILDLDGRIAFMNRNGRRTMEIDDFGTVARQPWPSLWPEESRAQVREAIAEAQHGKAVRFEAACPTVKGTAKWWDVSVSPVRDGDGRLVALLSISRDVSERRRALEQIETMVQEMRHRLRNAYAVSAAIASASGREQAEHREFAESLAQRFNSLSLAQSMLLDKGVRHTLRELVERIAAGVDPGSRGLVLGDLPDRELGEQQVRLAALVLGELVTNSFKHGALKHDRPVRIAASERDGMLVLTWAEELGPAAPLAEPNAGSGNGHALMTRLARAHGGSFVAEWAPGRLVARLTMPIQA